MARIFISSILVCISIFVNAQKIDLSATAEVINGEINLHWKKAEMTTIHYYEGEKFQDDHTWIGIKRIRPMVEDLDFESFDHTPFKGINSYRIKLKTREGNYIYSEEIDVLFEPLDFNILMYPNPASAWLVVNADKADAQFTVDLIDQYGTALTSASTKEGSCVLDTSEILEGMYFIKVNGSGATFKKAVVVNHR